MQQVKLNVKKDIIVALGVRIKPNAQRGKINITFILLVMIFKSMVMIYLFKVVYNIVIFYFYNWKSFSCETTSTIKACGSGKYCPEMSTKELPCPESFYCPSSNQKINCMLGMYCPQGKVEQTECKIG